MLPFNSLSINLFALIVPSSHINILFFFSFWLTSLKLTSCIKMNYISGNSLHLLQMWHFIILGFPIPDSNILDLCLKAHLIHQKALHICCCMSRRHSQKCDNNMTLFWGLLWLMVLLIYIYITWHKRRCYTYIYIYNSDLFWNHMWYTIYMYIYIYIYIYIGICVCVTWCELNSHGGLLILVIWNVIIKWI